MLQNAAHTTSALRSKRHSITTTTDIQLQGFGFEEKAMRFLKSLFVVAALSLTGPVWAHGGHGHGHGQKHHKWHHQGHHSEWRHDRHHAHGWRGRHDPYYASRYYYAPYPPYGYAVAAPGVHVVVPNIYIPLR
jgi:hypothetical protein